MKKKTIITIISIVAVLIVVGIIIVTVLLTDKKAPETAPLHTEIEVGSELYVQHDADNNDVYALLKSYTGTTIVYKPIFVEFTASKAWTRSGEYVDNTDKAPHSATSPEHYIAVTAGEEYFFKIYGVGITNGLWYTPVLFLDDNDEVVADALFATFSASKSGVTVTVPENATKMHITMYNNQKFTLQKVLYLSDEDFDDLPVFDPTELKARVDTLYEEYQKDKTVYKKLDTCNVTFVIDDTRAGIDEYADLFATKNIPVVLATIPELLIENASRQTEIRLQAARKVVDNGGEIIAHNDGVLTEDLLTDYNTLYSFFVRSKQIYNYYGFDVNGIILAGGAGQTGNREETEKWASAFYKYSDLYGVQYDKKEIALDSTFYHPRMGLNAYNNDINKIKQVIDEGIENKSWLVFYFHDEKDIQTDILEQVLNYVNSKRDEINVVTYKEMYDKTAVKESTIINTKTTYYVSSTGTSVKGTDINAPMSYETASKKGFISGDTILFKRGDIFYGTFSPSIATVDDKITTFASYGTGTMPIISAYKIASKSTSWQIYSKNIYKIDLTDANAVSGLVTTTSNTNDIGFLEDRNGKKYFNKKSSIGGLEDDFDFYSDGTYLYIKASGNPFALLGELKMATKNNLFILTSNIKIENLKFSGTGAHGLVNSKSDTQNVEISNNVIENIGGSYLSGTTRYGNGIELYATNAFNIVVQNNIIRNVYDVGFTMQGNEGSGKNVIVSNNVFVGNSQDSEIWGGGNATGVESYEFKQNISINCGRGWGYYARPDQYASAHILFWAYKIENTDIRFTDNIVYNPRRIYFIEETNGTNIWFKENDYIKSDNNAYYLADDAKIFRDYFKIAEKDTFIANYGKDTNSTFTQIEADDKIISIATVSDNVNEIKKLMASI